MDPNQLNSRHLVGGAAFEILFGENFNVMHMVKNMVILSETCEAAYHGSRNGEEDTSYSMDEE